MTYRKRCLASEVFKSRKIFAKNSCCLDSTLLAVDVGVDYVVRRTVKTLLILRYSVGSPVSVLRNLPL